MKAIIPVAGAGAKLRPHTYTQPKSLIPVAGKPILGFIIDQLMENGIEEFVFVIGYLKIFDHQILDVHSLQQLCLAYLKMVSQSPNSYQD